MIIAQEPFTTHIQRKVSGWGVVVLHQDETLTRLVNGGSPTRQQPLDKDSLKKSTAGKQMDKTEDTSDIKSGQAETESHMKMYKKKYKASGYRIQIYAGGNSRMARQEAVRLGGLCKKMFPELPVYTHFYPPRWICRVGDFRSYEEANAYLRQFREAGAFKEASIIKCTILVAY